MKKKKPQRVIRIKKTLRAEDVLRVITEELVILKQAQNGLEVSGIGILGLVLGRLIQENQSARGMAVDYPAWLIRPRSFRRGGNT